MCVRDQDLYKPEELDNTTALLFQYTRAVALSERGSKRALERFISERRKAVERLNEVSAPIYIFLPF